MSAVTVVAATTVTITAVGYIYIGGGGPSDSGCSNNVQGSGSFDAEDSGMQWR